MLERESITHPETRWLGDNETERGVAESKSRRSTHLEVTC